MSYILHVAHQVGVLHVAHNIIHGIQCMVCAEAFGMASELTHVHLLLHAVADA